MPIDDREDRPLRPIARGVSDALNHSYQGLNAVADGLRESLTRRRPAQDYRPAGDRPPERSRRPRRDDAGRRVYDVPPVWEQSATTQAVKPAGDQVHKQQAAAEAGKGGSAPAADARTAGLLGDLVHLVAEAMDIAGEVAYEFADAIAGEPADPAHAHHRSPEAAEAAELHAKGAAGGEATISFRISNTGHLALLGLTFMATNLRGPAGEIPETAVTFDPATVAAIPSGQHQEIAVHVAISEGQPAGVYRGIIQAEPGGAYKVLEVAVVAAA